MIIIGFVVAVMIFSSFTIVFNNSGNTLNNVKSNSNLNVNFFTTAINKTVITLSNPKTDINTPLEFYDNFMLSVNNNNNFIIENLTNGQILVTNLTYNTVCGSNYYGIIINSSILYVYLENNAVKEPYIYIFGYSTSNLNIISDSRLDSSIFNSSGVSTYYTLSNFGITANTNGIYAFFIGHFESPNCEYPLILHINYNGHIDEQKEYEYEIQPNSKESGYTMGNFFFFNTSSIGYFVNLNNFNINELSGNSYYGEMIYNNTYQNIFTLSNNLNYSNTYNSNTISYGCIYNDYKFTVNSEPKIFNNFRTGTQLSISLSFINANYYNNVFINSNNQLEYKNINVSLGFYTLPYTITNNSLYYAINSYSYGIINLISYKLNITSYNHNSNQIKDYFYFNNNIYYGNTYSLSIIYTQIILINSISNAFKFA